MPPASALPSAVALVPSRPTEQSLETIRHARPPPVSQPMEAWPWPCDHITASARFPQALACGDKLFGSAHAPAALDSGRFEVAMSSAAATDDSQEVARGLTTTIWAMRSTRPAGRLANGMRQHPINGCQRLHGQGPMRSQRNGLGALRPQRKLSARHLRMSKAPLALLAQHHPKLEATSAGLRKWISTASDHALCGCSTRSWPQGLSPGFQNAPLSRPQS